MTTHTFTKKEEIAHAVTHGIGVLFSIIALIVLIASSNIEKVWETTSVIIFGVTMFFMYISSTVCHGLPEGRWKDIFRICDHSSIYLFIAGTYTPILLGPLRSEIGWTLFSIIWAIALAGTIFKIFFVKKFLVLSTVFYILMGWLIIVVWEPLSKAIPETGLNYLLIGGIFYTVGAIFYVWRRFHYHHAIWHLFVIAGSVFHFFTIMMLIP
ncbi:hemolysin III family protein [Aquibacillus koreensis]|uniref:Hemolysin III family protein n=1 Tax=Aquibacillus koreensis TaxID=279446 RepID=A0A9X4AI07_9BACI|nr:hemolysin III family protein [Aquibacillus koreensis]MCT2538129.1 hemolysin III family protein [Aquibacillus koreensis]MDC3420652.1 hemolysin III family protein [Aquibacillus koreensis]